MQENGNINYNYLDLLNEQQRAAVVYKDGPALVIAGAGSGKTRVLTYKIVDLLACGIEPYRILALTFTNKAAREMKERIASVVGEKTALRLYMGTFHSIFLRILRRHADLIGFSPSFTVYDAADSKALVKSIIKDLGLDDKTYKASTIASIISNAKNALINAEQYAADSDYREADRRAKRPATAEIFRIYSERCRRASAMDFDDILLYMNVLLRDNPDVRRHYQDFFKYILVDEYQDTNFAQHLVITQLAGEKQNLTVVGDDAQSIYSFRGANIANILTLGKRFPGLRIFKLERNYRSTQNIINAAGSLIAKNRNQMPKDVYSENEPGEPVNIIHTYSDIEEAYLVAARISQSKLTNHDSYDDYAILYRTNAQSRVLEEALRKRNIPYRIYGGLAFYQRKEVKDAICYFRLAINPDDDEALRRVINYPARGIGETTMRKLTAAAMASGKSIYGVMADPAGAGVEFNRGTAAKLAAFRELVDTFAEAARSKNALEVAQLVYSKTGILSVLLSDTTPESISRQENLTELMSGVKDFVDQREEEGETDVSMETFLNDVFLATDQDTADETDEPKVTMMTAHAAKGLEFKHVTVVGVEEELFPSAMSMDTQAEIEEERRLLYVAITRAKTTCTLTYAGSRYRNGQPTVPRPSRFLSDIDRRFTRLENSSALPGPDTFVNPLKRYGANTVERRLSQPPKRFGAAVVSTAENKSRPASGGWGQQPLHNVSGLSTHTADELEEGMKIVHGKFGEGRITRVNRQSEPTVEVDFNAVGHKKLMLRFATFKIL